MVVSYLAVEPEAVAVEGGAGSDGRGGGHLLGVQRSAQAAVEREVAVGVALAPVLDHGDVAGRAARHAAHPRHGRGQRGERGGGAGAEQDRARPRDTPAPGRYPRSARGSPSAPSPPPDPDGPPGPALNPQHH